MSSVVTLGIHILDILGRPVRRFPPGQDLDIIDEVRLTVAGTAAGASVDLAKLGADVRTMGAVGDDAPGRFIAETMKGFGINTNGLVVKRDVQTSCTMLPIRPNGERPALHVLGANAKFSLADVNWDLIASADYLHFGGTYLLPELDGTPTATILRFAKEHNVVTSLDMIATGRPDALKLIEPALPYVDYFMPGLDEARSICGMGRRSDVVAFFLSRGVQHTVFKMGACGSSIATKGVHGEILVPAFDAPVVDSTGCGDSYCAAFIVGLSRGWDLETCGRFGAAAGALVVSGLGSDAGITDFDATLEFMNGAREVKSDVVPFSDSDR